MKSILLVVESPKKAITIQSFLGKEYIVKSTKGHLFDLPKSSLGFNTKYEPEWELQRNKKKILSELTAIAKNAKEILIATDPDREGEAIAFHIFEHFRLNKLNSYRIKFNEITKDIILQSIDGKQGIDFLLVESQIARRILDRIIGYGMSPVLWKIKTGLSAGRVQTIPLKWIVEREEEIENFIPEEYWNLNANFIKDNNEYKSELKLKDKEKLDSKKLSIVIQKIEIDLLKEINFDLEKSIIHSNSSIPFKVKSISQKIEFKNPPPPFKTSDFQKEASMKLGISPSLAMGIAGNLYEGKDIGSGKKGLITYLRTDSTRVSPSAEKKAMEFWKKQGKKSFPLKNKKSGSKIQDAHEAIRPTDINLTPQKVKPFLNSLEFKIYDLIWKRYASAFLKASSTEKTEILFSNGNIDFLFKNFSLIDPGFKEIYGETPENKFTHNLSEGDEVLLKQLEMEKKFTDPPSRFTESSLVAKMEKTGVGRPSTYATSIDILYKRNYVVKIKKSIEPTDLGKKVIEELILRFEQLLEDNYTSKMEDFLDKIEEGSLKRTDFLREVDEDFHKQKNANPIRKKKMIEVQNCPICEKGILKVKKTPKKKNYKICSRFPECDFMEYI